MEECIFCKIANKEEKADVLYEDEKFIAFKDIKPDAPFHVLIVPKKHIPSLNDIEDNDKEIISDAFFLAKEIANKNGISNGYKVNLNVGREGGQIIFHLHFHLLGGFKKGQN